MFNTKFVYLDWDDSLDGKRAFVADNIFALRDKVDSTGKECLVKLSHSLDNDYPFGVNDDICYKLCYYDPDFDKSRRMTNRELSKWLAEGNGECKMNGLISTYFCYRCSAVDEGDLPVDFGIVIRSWNEKDWHEPIIED